MMVVMEAPSKFTVGTRRVSILTTMLETLNYLAGRLVPDMGVRFD
jgi:hypothetical protein